MIIRCKDIISLLSDLYDNTLDKDIYESVMDHINHCKFCLALYHTFTKTMDLYHSLKPLKLSPQKRRMFHRWLHIKICKTEVKRYRL